MLKERHKVLCGLSYFPRQITIPHLSFAEAETCIGTCHQQDKLLALIGTCGELSRWVISHKEGRGQVWEEGAKHGMKVTT